MFRLSVLVIFAVVVAAAPQVAVDAALYDDSETVAIRPASAVVPIGHDYHGSLRDTWALPHWRVSAPVMDVFGHRIGLNVVFGADETCNTQPVPGYQLINGSNPVGNATIGQIKDDIDNHTQDQWKASTLAGFNDVYQKGQAVTEHACAWPEANAGRRLQQLVFTGRWTMTILGGGTIGLLYSIDQLAKSTIPAAPAPEAAPGTPAEEIKSLATVASLITMLALSATLVINAKNGNFARIDRFLYSLLRVVLIVLLSFVTGRIDELGQWVPPADLDLNGGLAELAGGLVRPLIQGVGLQNRQNLMAQATRVLTCG